MASIDALTKRVLIDFIILANEETDFKILDEIKSNLMTMDINKIYDVSRYYINRHDKSYVHFLVGYAASNIAHDCCNDELNGICSVLDELYEFFGIKENIYNEDDD